MPRGRGWQLPDFWIVVLGKLLEVLVRFSKIRIIKVDVLISMIYAGASLYDKNCQLVLKDSLKDVYLVLSNVVKS